MILHKTVLIVVEKNKKLLLIKRGTPPMKGCWAAPGGHVDNGETPYQAAVREAREEAGDIEVENKPLYVFTHDVRIGHRHKAYVFVGKVSGKLRAGTDAAEVKWFCLEELKKLDILDYTLRVLNKFFVPRNFNSNDKE